MADGGGDGGGGEGGGSAEWQPIYDRVQAQAEALAADRARLEAASKVQRESWEATRRLQRRVEELQAAAREKDAEIERLRAEAADASKKLVEARQADAGRRMRWEAAYVDLILGASQKLAELRDVDMEDARICAETPTLRLGQNTVDQACVASDLSTELRKLKQAYETMSSKKDKEVSALLSEKELLRNQLGVMQQDYDLLLRNKTGEAAQTTEATQKLQRSVDDLKVPAQKKDDEIGRLQAEVVAAEKKLQIAQKLQQSVDDLKASAQKKDDEIDRLRAEAVAAEKKIQTAQKLQQSVDDLKALAQKKDDEIHRLQAEAVAAEKKLRKMQSLVKEKDDEIQTIKDGHDESNQKRRRVSSSSNDDEQSGSVEHDDEQSESDESILRIYNRMAPRPLRSRKLHGIINGRRYLVGTGHWGNYVRLVSDRLADQPDKHKDFVEFVRNFEGWRIRDVARAMEEVLDGHPDLIRQFNQFLPNNCQIKVEEADSTRKSSGENIGAVAGLVKLKEGGSSRV